jgi:hypothetical protein
MARNFGDKVVSCDVEPARVFVDTTLIDSCFIISECSGFPAEQEVIFIPALMKLN